MIDGDLSIQASFKNIFLLHGRRIRRTRITVAIRRGRVALRGVGHREHAVVGVLGRDLDFVHLGLEGLDVALDGMVVLGVLVQVQRDREMLQCLLVPYDNNCNL